MSQGDGYKDYFENWFIDMDFGDGSVLYILVDAVSDLFCSVY